jgi:hypothetical protein
VLLYFLTLPLIAHFKEHGLDSDYELCSNIFLEYFVAFVHWNLIVGYMGGRQSCLVFSDVQMIVVYAHL